MTDDTPAKPPRVWTFVGSYTQESGGEYWIVDGPRPTEKNKFDLVERSYASRLEQELAFVKTQWKQTSDLLEQERNRLTAELADVRKELEKHRWRQVGAQVDPTPEAYAVLEAERTQALAQAAALAGALEGLTNAALAGLKPLPSQIELGFDALAAYREFLKERE